MWRNLIPYSEFGTRSAERGTWLSVPHSEFRVPRYPLFLKASHILPIEGPPLSPGVIHVLDGRIKEIGDNTLLKSVKDDEKIIDLTRHVLLPGFVNAHCHLELTCIGPLRRGQGFVSWIKELVAHKNLLNEADMVEGIKKGILHLLKSGVTCVGDHISFNTPWEKIINSPLRGKLFGETLGVVPEVCEDIYATLIEIKKKVEQSSGHFIMHVSPHSVHAVHPDTLSKVLKEQPGPLSCHLAESECEVEYFSKNKGDLAKLVREMNPYLKRHTTTGLGYLKEQKLPVEKILVVHGNYLDKEDLQIVKEKNLSIVHCPGSHYFFGHHKFPVERYLKEGINIALGTDSITSNDSLDFLSELRKVKNTRPKLSPTDILKVATQNGAQALNMASEIGSLVPGKKADIIGFKLKKNQKPEEIPFKAKEVDFVMIEGKMVRLP